GIIGLHNSTPHGEAGKAKDYGHPKKLPGTKAVQGGNLRKQLMSMNTRKNSARPVPVLGFELWFGLNYNLRVPDEFVNPINASTRICAVYGFPIKHSASPAMQNAGLAAL